MGAFMGGVSSVIALIQAVSSFPPMESLQDGAYQDVVKRIWTPDDHPIAIPWALVRKRRPFPLLLLPPPVSWEGFPLGNDNDVT